MQRPKKIILAVTGGFGTGKSTVVKIFLGKGSKAIDADKIAHRLILPGKIGYKKIISLFGVKILNSHKAIDHKKLAAEVFSNRKKLNQLNKIVHPQVIRVMLEDIKTSGSKFIILDLPLLFEAGLERLADKIIVVKAKQETQIKRLLKKTTLSKGEILKRIKMQMPLSLKIRKADFVIDNNGSLNQTIKQVKEIRRRLWKN